MVRPGRRNLITDVDGVKVGNAEDAEARTGVTVVLPDEPAVAAVDMRGGAPGTRETDALDPTCLVERIDAIVLSGGSVFGLEAASGVVNHLASRGRGFPVGPFDIPIVPAAILFDLANGGDKDWGEDPPYRRLGREALDAVGPDFALGNAGAGMGATAGDLKGGLGSASAVADDGLQVGAIVAANPVGAVTMPGQGALWAAPYLQPKESIGPKPDPDAPMTDLDLPTESRIAGHTTIAVVATNLALDKARALRIAIMAHDGLARAVRPAHTPFDGDTVFVLSTGHLSLRGAVPMALARLGSIAADCLTRAIARGVAAAADLGETKSYRTLYGPGERRDDA